MRKTFSCSRFQEFLNDLVEIVHGAGRIRWCVMIARAQDRQIAEHDALLNIAGKQAQIMEHFRTSGITSVDRNPRPVFLEGNHVYKYRFCTGGVYVE
jgi:hypothetical protein